MKVTLSPYLKFNGNCRQAMEAYQSIFGGKLNMQTYKQSGVPTEKQLQDKIMHSLLERADFSLMASDNLPNSSVVFGDNVHISIVGSDVDKMSEWFNKLADGGNIFMPLAKQFWGDTFGMLTDKFGVHWMLNITQQKAK